MTMCVKFRSSFFLHAHGCQQFFILTGVNILQQLFCKILEIEWCILKRNIYPYVKVTGYLSVCLYMYRNICLTTALIWTPSPSYGKSYVSWRIFGIEKHNLHNIKSLIKPITFFIIFYRCAN